MQKIRMKDKNLVLGIDTSNYKTSLAITDEHGLTVVDSRKPLKVKQGERGLRQSYALYQHMENIPDMIIDLYQQVQKEQIGAVAVSSKPRPVEGSYMPVFKAGVNYGSVLAASLGVPLFEFSHQEGHLASIKHGSALENQPEYLAFHLSGGTSELLHIRHDEIHIIGGSKDISFGQVLDRVGVALNFSFPAGQDMDLMAMEERKKQNFMKGDRIPLKKIPLDGLYVNLSGIESQCQRRLAEGSMNELLVLDLFNKISNCLCELTDQAVKETGCPLILFTGGVSSSRFIREHISAYFENKDITLEFGIPALSSDNAVGISILGGKKLWQSNL